MLAKAPIFDAAWLLADWIEFKVLTSEYDSFLLNELLYIADEEQDEENIDFVEQDAKNEELLETAIAELEQRREFLKHAYPFDFTLEGSELVLKEDIGEGGYVYLYCLFFSHINREDVLIPDPPHSNADREIMQICSTLAAAGKLQGNAVSFGFPRPDHSNFIDALRKVFEKIGEGIVVDTIPDGAPSNEKDARIDIIAWENTPDSGAGRIYLLGQVASGANWNDKSIIGEIEPFHNIWFIRQPASNAIPSMFIPFCLDVDSKFLKDKLYYETIKFGNLLYRYRLPLYASKGYELAATQQENGLYIERFDDFYKVKEYVNNFRQLQLSTTD